MPVVVDTYNVLHTVGVLPPELAGLEIEGLVRLLGCSRYRDEKTTLVCDGLPVGPKPAPQSAVSIRFAGRDRTADDLIGQVVRSSSAPRRLTVVSSDHAVQRTARKRRCKILTSQEFLQQLADDAVAAGAVSRTAIPERKPQSMSQEQVDRWVKIFNIDERMASVPSRGNAAPATPAMGSGPGDAGTPPGATSAPPAPPHMIPELGPGEETPQSLIEQAEQLWEQARPTKKGVE